MSVLCFHFKLDLCNDCRWPILDTKTRGDEALLHDINRKFLSKTFRIKHTRKRGMGVRQERTELEEEIGQGLRRTSTRSGTKTEEELEGGRKRNIRKIMQTNKDERH